MKRFLYRVWFAVKRFFENVGEYVVNGFELAYRNTAFVLGVSATSFVASFIMLAVATNVLDALALSFMIGYSVWILGMFGYWVAGIVILVLNDIGTYDVKEDLHHSYTEAGIVYEAQRTAGGRYE